MQMTYSLVSMGVDGYIWKLKGVLSLTLDSRALEFVCTVYSWQDNVGHRAGG